MAAGLFNRFPSGRGVRISVRSHSSLPVRRSKHCVNNFSFSKPVRKTRLAVRTGDDFPALTGVLQTTFLALSNSTGKPVSEETPEPLGPRKRVQSSADAENRHNASARQAFIWGLV